jgi:hypothetical protein
VIVHFSWSPERKQLELGGTRGPDVVQESQWPCAMKFDKAGEHVVLCPCPCHAMPLTGMADKIFKRKNRGFDHQGAVPEVERKLHCK